MILTSRLTRILWTFARYTNREMNIFENMTRNDLDFAYFLIHETALHVLNGKDLEDKNSVGGWSQREVNLFVKVQQDAEKI